MRLYDLIFARVRTAVVAYLDGVPDVFRYEVARKFADRDSLVRDVSETLTSVLVKDAMQWAESVGCVLYDPRQAMLFVRGVLTLWFENDEMDLLAVADLFHQSPPRLVTPPVAQRDEDLASIVQECRETRHLVRNLEQETQFRTDVGEEIHFRRTPGLSARQITSVAYASELLRRHQSLNRARAIVTAAEFLWKGEERPLQELRQTVADFGLFIKEYCILQMEQRIRDRAHWILFHGGLPSSSAADAGLDARADIQIHLPADTKGAKSVAWLPDDSETEDGEKRFRMYDGENAASHFLSHPASVGMVEDLSVEDAVAHTGYASTVRSAAFEHIKREVNLERFRRIRFLIAEIASVIAVTFRDGTGVRFETPITNTVSKMVHVGSKKYPAILGWRRKGDMVPVPSVGGAAALEVEWDVVIHDLYQ